MNNLVKYLVSSILEEVDLEEAKQLGTIYHFTSLKGIDSILNSNEFWGSKIELNDTTDKDFRSFYNKSKEEFQEKGIDKLYYFSTTRNKLFYLKNPKGTGGSIVRILLDGDKLSNKYKFTPFYYYSDEMIDEPASKYDQDESEERILLGTQSKIKNATSYIKEVHILLDEIYDNQEYLKIIDKLLKKYPIIKCYYKEKLITLKDYIKNIVPTIEPYRSEEDIFESQIISDLSFKDALISLVQYMIEQDMNILPLPTLKFIDNDIENANNILGKTAYYDPNNCSITLYTLNRHPKDILRSFSHEMIHRIQDNENRLNNIHTTNTNEDGGLDQLEREAYEHGNMCFRNWEDSIKNNINEWIIDTPKYNYTSKLSDKILSQLHELKVNEITLNPNNAVEIYGDLNNGDFTVGEHDYNYRIIKLDKNPYNSDSFYNIDFHEIGNKNSNLSLPTGNAKENYIKILSTIYKIILDFTQNKSPEYIGISSLDESGYWNIYNNLTKTNQIPGYSRKDVGLQFKDKEGKTGKFIILKRVNEI